MYVLKQLIFMVRALYLNGAWLFKRGRRERERRGERGRESTHIGKLFSRRFLRILQKFHENLMVV